MTAIDEDDAVAGYAVSGGADQDLFAINSAGNLRFSTAPDFETPADADRDNAYEVTVTVTSGFGTRANTTVESLLVTVTDVDEPPATPDAAELEPAEGSIAVIWLEPENTGPPIDDYDLQYRTVQEPDETLGTREWTQVGRDLWNVGCDIWEELGDAGRDIWDDLWDNAGEAGREIGLAIGDRMFSGADEGAGWGDFWNVGCDIWEDLGDVLWGPIWDAGEDILDGISEGFADWFGTVGEAGQGIGGLIGDIGGAIGDIGGAIGDIFGGIGSLIGGFFALDASDWTNWTSWTHTGPRTDATITGLADNGAYQVRVRANNQEGSGGWSEPSTARTPARSVTNAPPVFTSSATLEVREPATAVGVITATDADAQDSVWAYKITGGADAARLRIDSTTGALSFNAAVDFERPADADLGNDYEITVTALGGDGSRLLAAVQALVVTVTDDSGEAAPTPQAPLEPRLVDASETTLTIEWQQPPDGPAGITGYDVRFRPARTGVWMDWPHTSTARRAAISSLADNTRYEVQVRASNQAGAGDWSSSLMAATAGNRPPQFTSPASVSVGENTLHAVRITAVDPDPQDTVTTHGITSGADQALFEIDEIGNLAFKSAPDYDEPSDSNRNNIYEVAVAATSGQAERISTATQHIRVRIIDDSAEAPPAASGATYVFEGSAIVLSWEPVPDADYYNIYYDDFFSSACQVRSGRASFCEQLAANITATTYTHTSPDGDDNYYWVVACNSSGCSPVDSNNPATTAGTAPVTPGATYVFEGSAIVLSWEPVPDADYYNIYYDDFFSSACQVRSGRASFCEQLAANITATTYTHTSPDGDDNYYWVVACNSSGCSPVDSNNPATTAGTAPVTPGATYVFEGSAIVLSWEPVPDADYYNIYYDDFFSSACQVRSGRASFCEQLAANITATTYTHTSPDGDDNYYWVVACNSSGCSPVDSNNPATTAGTAPVTPGATYVFEGSAIVLSWEPVPDADYYNIYYDDFFSSACQVRSGRASFCEQLAANITATTYTHTSPDGDDNYYWVVACNSSGCSPVDSNNPATTAGTAPVTPGATYVFEGSAIVLSWEPVPDADYYNIYYDDFFSSACQVRSGRASFCEQLAANITATTYTHTSPDGDDNYYWVVACNSSGCSPVDSNNPATTAEGG